MGVEFPQIDQILHASLGDDAYSQKEYVNLMNQSNNFINLTFQGLMDRISREYNYESIVDILKIVNVVLEEEADSCENQIVFDDFVKNASLVSTSLKKIIYSPSRKLIKIDKNVPANKVTRFDSRTMTWLSRRPGVTIDEKISPKNVIPTKVTYFTADTAENRHTMYLFDILYDYLYEKIYPQGTESKCESCPFTEKKCHLLYDKLKAILFLKHKIKTTDLKDVLKQKQLRQNNKLLSDKEYKQIWDAVSDIDYYEQNCRNVWDHLKERYQFIAFLFVCAKISSLENIKVFDEYSQLIDKNGLINILNKSGLNTMKFYNAASDSELIVSLFNEKISVRINGYEQVGKANFKKYEVQNLEYDLHDIFDEFETIKVYENRYKSLISLIEEQKKQIKTIQDEIEDLELKREAVQKLASALRQLLVEDSYYGKEKEQEAKD